MSKEFSSPKGEAIPNWGNDSVDSNYNAPGKPYDGTPVHVDPVSLTAEGYTPEDHPTAQELNYHFNEIGNHLKYLARFSAVSLQDMGAVGLSMTARDIDYSTVNARYYIGGFDFSFNNAVIGSSPDGRNWVAETIDGAATDQCYALHCDDGGSTVVALIKQAAATDTLHCYTKTTISGNFASVSSDIQHVGGQPIIRRMIRTVAGTLLAVGTNNGTDSICWRSTDLGTNWTEIALASAGTGIGQHGIAQSTEGDNRIVMVDGTRIFYSDDDGVSFTSITDSVGFDNDPSVVWSATEKLFMAQSGGQPYTSVDGITWVLRTGTNFFGDPAVASIGGAWIAPVKVTKAGSAVLSISDKPRYQVSYDNGDTWYEVTLADWRAVREDDAPFGTGVRVNKHNGEVMFFGTIYASGGATETYLNFTQRMFPNDWVEQ